MKKRIAALLCAVLCIVLLIVPSSAHSGRTDSRGGHYNTATGEYHYHHGYPAHQHPNGVCPYEDDTSNSDIIDNDVAGAEDDNDDLARRRAAAQANYDQYKDVYESGAVTREKILEQRKNVESATEEQTGGSETSTSAASTSRQDGEPGHTKSTPSVIFFSVCFGFFIIGIAGIIITIIGHKKK